MTQKQISRKRSLAKNSFRKSGGSGGRELWPSWLYLCWRPRRPYHTDLFVSVFNPWRAFASLMRALEGVLDKANGCQSQNRLLFLGFFDLDDIVGAKYLNFIKIQHGQKSSKWLGCNPKRVLKMS